ncbi:YggU family protein [archaeon]|jgi:uncharacterized protein (TIGR00251 family)|nr:YggU family protein [archaeon]
MEIKNKFYIIVKTNTPKNEILSFDEVRQAYKVNIKASPEKGKANLEIEKFLTKHFKKKIKIISGFKSKKKLIELSP